MKFIKNIIPWLVIFISVYLITAPILSGKTFTFHDEIQIASLYEFIKTIDLGQFPARWAPDAHFTYGSPLPEFNYQIPYYLAYVFHYLGFGLFHSYVSVIVFSALIGAIGMYLFSRRFLSVIPSLAAAILYTYTPYHAVDLYVRAALGESLALGILPFLLLTFYRCLNSKSRLVNTLFLSLAISTLVLTHQPTTVLALPIIYLIFIVTAIKQRKPLVVVDYIVSGIIAFLLSSYYLFPLIFESKFIKPVASFNFYDHFPFIKQLIIPSWGYGASIWGPNDSMSFQVGIVNIIFIVISFLYVPKWIKDKKDKGILAILFLVSTLFLIFLMNIRSSFLWETLPFSQSIQFPWRILGPVSLFTSCLFIFIISSSKSKILSIAISFLVVVSSLVLNLKYFYPGDYFVRSDDYYLRLYLPNIVLNSGETVSSDYLLFTEDSMPLPIDAVRPATMSAKITSTDPKAKIEIESNNPYRFKATIDINEEKAVVNFHNFYFPGWQVYDNNKLQQVFLDKNGSINLNLSNGRHELSLEFVDTPIRKYSNYLSVGSALLIFAILSIKLSSWILKNKQRP